MPMIQLVILTSDHDCDGVSHAAHRIDVPAERAIPLWTDHDACMAYAKTSGQMSGYYDGADDVMPVAEFLTRYPLSARDRAYFDEAGYTSGHIGASWNPWVYDDSIGIPALDTRYDECEVW